MAKKSGLAGRLRVSSDGGSTYTNLGNLTGVNLDYQVTMLESSDIDVESREYIAGMDAWTGTADGFYNDTDAGQDLVRTALMGKTLINFEFVPYVGSGAPKYTGTGFMSAKSLNLANLDSLVAHNLTITGSGALTEGTQS